VRSCATLWGDHETERCSVFPSPADPLPAGRTRAFRPNGRAAPRAASKGAWALDLAYPPSLPLSACSRGAEAPRQGRAPCGGARGSIALGGGGGVDGKASLRTFSQRGFAILPPSSSRHLEKKAARQRFTWLASPSQPGRFAPPDSKTEHPPWGDARRLFSTSQPFFRSPNAVAIETKTEQPILRESA
jgi:hypothetical protein